MYTCSPPPPNPFPLFSPLFSKAAIPPLASSLNTIIIGFGNFYFPVLISKMLILCSFFLWKKYVLRPRGLLLNSSSHTSLADCLQIPS